MDFAEDLEMQTRRDLEVELQADIDRTSRMIHSLFVYMLGLFCGFILSGIMTFIKLGIKVW